MRSSKATDTALASTFTAYKAFHRAADRGDYRKAIAVFKAQPHLMNHMTLLEISVHCRMVSNQLARKDAMQFIEAVERRMLENVRLLEMARLYDNVVREEKRKHEEG
jgi:hypothetical protein